MKQLLFLCALMGLGALGALVHPFWAVMLYYFLALLRPQHLWDWALPVEWRWSLIAAALVLGGLVISPPRDLLRRRLPGNFWLVLLFGLLLAASCLTAYQPSVAQPWAIEYAKILLMALVAMALIDRLWQVHALAIMVLGVLGYVAWEINLTYFMHRRLDVLHYGFGGLDNNGTGLMLAMALPLAYACALGTTRWWLRGIVVFIGLVLLHAVLMTYSRGAMLAGVVGITWLLVRHRARAQALGIALVLVVALWFLAGQEIRDRFSSTANFRQDPSAQLRMESWASGWRMAWDHPLTGFGIRNSNEFIYNYGADRTNRTIHCQYLQVAADAGFPAAFVHVLVLLVCLTNANRTIRRCRRDLGIALGDDDQAHAALMRRTHDLALACQGSLIIYAVGALFLSLEFFEIFWLFAVMVSVLPNVLAHALGDSTAPGPVPWAPAPDPRAGDRGAGSLGPQRGLA